MLLFIPVLVLLVFAMTASRPKSYIATSETAKTSSLGRSCEWLEFVLSNTTLSVLAEQASTLDEYSTAVISHFNAVGLNFLSPTQLGESLREPREVYGLLTVAELRKHGSLKGKFQSRTCTVCNASALSPNSECAPSEISSSWLERLDELERAEAKDPVGS